MKAIKPWHLAITGIILFLLKPLLTFLKFKHDLHPFWAILYIIVCLTYLVVVIIKIVRFIKRIQLKPEQ